MNSGSRLLISRVSLQSKTFWCMFSYLVLQSSYCKLLIAWILTFRFIQVETFCKGWNAHWASGWEQGNYCPLKVIAQINCKIFSIRSVSQTGLFISMGFSPGYTKAATTLHHLTQSIFSKPNQVQTDQTATFSWHWRYSWQFWGGMIVECHLGKLAHKHKAINLLWLVCFCSGRVDSKKYHYEKSS